MRYTACVLLLGLACLLPERVAATTVIPLDFKTIAGNADVIVHGRVVALTAQWASGRNGIDTLVTVAVTRYLKGDLGAQIVFRVPGGQIGRLRSVRVGAPRFQEGDDVVVFLASGGPEYPHIVGFNQGVLRVTIDRASGAQVVASPMLAAEVSTPTPLVRGDPSRRPETLAQFETRVRSVLEDIGTSRRPAGSRPVQGKARRVR